MPILEPVTVVEGDEITDWLDLGHMLTPGLWGQVSLIQQWGLDWKRGISQRKNETLPLENG